MCPATRYTLRRNTASNEYLILVHSYKSKTRSTMHKNGCRVSVYLSCNARFVSPVLSMRASGKKARAMHFLCFKNDSFLHFVVCSRVV